MTRAINTNLSYLRLLKLIGLLGISLPILCPLITWEFHTSISDYYYTEVGVLFTGILILCGAFLISYRGYQERIKKVSDNTITTIAGLLIIVAAIIPTELHDSGPCGSGPTPIFHCDPTLEIIHFGCVTLFLYLVAYMSYVRFTSDDEPASYEKKVRDRIHRFCGMGIWVLISIGVIIRLIVIREDTILTFWFEVALLLLFGTSWLVKGNILVDLGLQKPKNKLSAVKAQQLAVNISDKLKFAEEGREITIRVKKDQEIEITDKR